MGTSIPKLAIAWCATNPNVSTVILGASKEHHLTETLGSLDLLPQLDNDLMNKIETILGNKPKHPDF
jgi:aryl-alcohol dehydrogenase-like predicted oxidoreductase